MGLIVATNTLSLNGYAIIIKIRLIKFFRLLIRLVIMDEVTPVAVIKHALKLLYLLIFHSEIRSILHLS